jgi:aspartate aminotransferase
LYGQRVGCLSVVAANEDEAKRVESQMKMVIRPMYSNPPRYGARLITTVLADPKLSSDFIVECKDMADRINRMRGLLRSELEAAGSTRSWDHITHQIGMFCYSGLTAEEVTALKEKHHVYCTLDGRISMAVSNAGIRMYPNEKIMQCFTFLCCSAVGSHVWKRELHCSFYSRCYRGIRF